MKIALAAGTRPEFIQFEPIIRELNKREMEYILIHSGQHYDYEMDKIFFDEMQIPSPTHFLSVGSKLPGEQVGEIISKSEKIFLEEKPDILLVTGDTNTALGVALAANKTKIKIGHFEAGMRSFDKTMPEETNRIIIDNISDYLFTPTHKGIENLNASGIKDNVFMVGDVMLDSMLHYQNNIRMRSQIVDELGLVDNQFFVLTIHREANTDNETRLRSIIDALSLVHMKIIFPIHPRTKQKIKNYGIQIPNNFITIPPQGYFEFLRLIYHSQKLLTDSGGAQKQAFFLNKPCVTLRANSEWNETIENGWNILVDSNKEKILSAISDFNPEVSPDLTIFGNGHCAEKIIDIITG
jgi:UDP-N-acetylglucosamine 2-epimerase (non-hydrolysing)